MPTLGFRQSVKMGKRTQMSGVNSLTAASQAGVSYRQLDYWARTELVQPTECVAAGSGSRRLYSPSDVLALIVVRTLLQAGMTLTAVRGVFTDGEFGSLLDSGVSHLVIRGDETILVSDTSQLLDVLTTTHGFFHVIPLEEPARVLVA